MTSRRVEALSVVAVVIVAVTQLYLSIFVLRPVARKASLEEEVAKASILNRNTAAAIVSLTAAEQALSAERTVVERERQRVALATDAARKELQQLGEREKLLSARAHELSRLLQLRGGERVRSERDLARMRLGVDRKYATLLPLLVADLQDAIVNGCMSHKNSTLAAIGDAPEDALVMAFDEVLEKVLASPQFQLLSATDRARFAKSMSLARVRVEGTRAAIAAKNLEWRDQRAVWHAAWKEMGGAFDSKGQPIYPVFEDVEKQRDYDAAIYAAIIEATDGIKNPVGGPLPAGQFFEILKQAFADPKVNLFLGK